jgi:hypothetical protein
MNWAKIIARIIARVISKGIRCNAQTGSPEFLRRIRICTLFASAPQSHLREPLWYNSPTMMIPTIINAGTPRTLESFTSTVHRRQLTTPLLLWLMGHRPLTFISGQMLYVLAPLCALLGWEESSEWAALLSAPDANQRLTTMLATSQVNTSQVNVSQLDGHQVDTSQAT